MLVFAIAVIFFLGGCEIEGINFDDTSLNVDCSISRQYLDYAYYVEGTCKNNSSKEYNYLQVEFICYDNAGNNLGNAIDNTNNVLSGDSWKFKAIFLGSNEENISNCKFHEVSGW